MDLINSDSDLSTLAAAVNATGLEGFLRDQNPITVFAPTNDAFAKLGGLVNTLLGKPDVLKQILAYHVIPGSLYKGAMHDGALHTFEEVDQIALDHSVFSDQVDG